MKKHVDKKYTKTKVFDFNIKTNIQKTKTNSKLKNTNIWKNLQSLCYAAK